MAGSDVSSVLTSNLDTRFRLTHLLPILLLTLLLGVFVLAGAPAHAPNFTTLTHPSSGGWGAFLTAVAGSLLLALLLRPFQLQLVRALEGYWGDGLLARGIGDYFLASEQARLRSLEYRAAISQGPGQVSLNTHITRLRADLDGRAAISQGPGQVSLNTHITRLRADEDEATKRFILVANHWVAGTETQARLLDELRWFPAPDRLLPTRLGNTLRAAEDTAGQRYGLDTIVVWPRLYPMLSEPLRAQADLARDEYDTAVRLCAGLAILAVVFAALLLPAGGWWRLTPIVLLAMSALSYRAACTGARYYGLVLFVAFDLHRFDLLNRLRVELPARPQDELTINRQVTAVLSQSKPEGVLRRRYVPPVGVTPP